MNTRNACAVLTVLSLAGAAHCSRNDASASAPAAETSPGPALRTPPTTSPSIALSNLDAEIADREKRARAGDFQSELDLVGRYGMRSQYEGRVSDLIAEEETSARLVAAHPDDARAHMARASGLSAIHDFAAAAEQLDEAARLGAEPLAVARARAGLLLATGRLDEAAAVLPKPVDGSPLGDFVMGASIEARMGEQAPSDALFESARRRYRDVSPFTVAWMDFERARSLELEGRRGDARAYLAKAVTVLPCYAHAVVHLAALEPPDKAIALLHPLEKTSDDPTVLAAEADALRRDGRAQDAKAMADRARARFDEVLARLPKAYANHAASFYLGMGADPHRALELAAADAKNRPTAESLELWLTAAQAADVRDATCDAARAVLAKKKHAPAGLHERAEGAAKGCP